MGMSFKIQKPAGTREYITMMGYGSFGDIVHVGKLAELDMSEYLGIVEYSGLDEEKVIPLEDVQKILPFYQKLLNIVEELDRKGISLLTETEKQRQKREMARMGTTPRHRWEGVKTNLRDLINLCEKAIKADASIVIII